MNLESYTHYTYLGNSPSEVLNTKARGLAFQINI